MDSWNDQLIQSYYRNEVLGWLIITSVKNTHKWEHLWTKLMAKPRVHKK